MKNSPPLLERLYYEHSNLGKEALLIDYFADTPDPDRGLCFGHHRWHAVHSQLQTQHDARPHPRADGFDLARHEL